MRQTGKVFIEALGGGRLTFMVTVGIDWHSTLMDALDIKNSPL